MRSTANHLIAGMMMLAAILLVWNRSAHGALEVLEQAIEANLREVTLPARAGGSVVVRQCADCSPIVLRVDAATRYQVLGSAADLTLDEFLELAAKARSDMGMIGVFHEPEGNRVTRLVLGAPATP